MSDAPRDRWVVAMSILLISDDADLSLLIREPLAAAGFRLSWAVHTRDGVIESLDGGHSVVLLDVSTKDADAVRVVEWCRSRSTVPIVVLSPSRHRAGLVAALDAGAADYIAGPIDPDEVVARVRVVLRERAARQCDIGQLLEVGDIQLETASRRVRVEGRIVTLTSVEYDVLEYLMRERGRAVSRDELMAAVCRRAASPLDRSLDVHVSHVRRKLGSHGSRIRTIRGTGYMMTGSSGVSVARGSAG